MNRFPIVCALATLALVLAAGAVPVPAAAQEAAVTGLVEWQVDGQELDGEWWSVLTTRNVSAHDVELIGVNYRLCGLDATVRENLKDVLRSRLVSGDLLVPPGGEQQLRLGPVGTCYESFELRYCGETCAQVEVLSIGLE